MNASLQAPAGRSHSKREVNATTCGEPVHEGTGASPGEPAVE